jgi:hypothetical protein
MSDDLDIISRQGKSIILGTKTVEVRPLVIRKYREAAEIIGKIAARILNDIPEFDPKDNISEQIEKLPAIISYPEISDLIAVCTGETADWLENNMTVEQMSAALVTIIEINGIDRIIENFTRLAPMIAPKIFETVSSEYGFTPDYIIDNMSPGMLNLYLKAAVKRISAQAETGDMSESMKQAVNITEKNESILGRFGIGKKKAKG